MGSSTRLFKRIHTYLYLRRTVDLCRQIESAGCSYLTVHARTKHERHEPIHEDALVLVADTIRSIPVVLTNSLIIEFLRV